MKCLSCKKQIHPNDSDAGTYKEKFCSEICEDYQEKIKEIFHLKTAIISALEISDLWLPREHGKSEGHRYDEYRALSTMYRMFKRQLGKEQDE